MVPDKSPRALTANCVVFGSSVTALCACHILITAIGRRLHPNSRHLRWAKEYQRSDRVSEQWKTVRYVELLFYRYFDHALVHVNMLVRVFHRYNQVTAMLRYYKTPVLLIEFSEGQSFSLQVRMCAEARMCHIRMYIVYVHTVLFVDSLDCCCCCYCSLCVCVCAE